MSEHRPQVNYLSLVNIIIALNPGGLGNDQIYVAKKYSKDALIKDLIEAHKKQESMQASIDSLMLEFCPEEMDKEQIREWARNQKVIGAEAEILVDKAIENLRI